MTVISSTYESFFNFHLSVAAFASISPASDVVAFSKRQVRLNVTSDYPTNTIKGKET